MSSFLSAEDAARVCGVSPKTVRRWVRSGRLKADKRGRSFRIHPDALQPFRGQDSAHADPPNGTADIGDRGHDGRGGQGVPVELFREQQAQLLARTEAAAMWQARAEMLAGQLADLREHVRALEAPRPADVDPDTTPGVGAAPGPATRPWWRFWR